MGCWSNTLFLAVCYSLLLNHSTTEGKRTVFALCKHRLIMLYGFKLHNWMFYLWYNSLIPPILQVYMESTCSYLFWGGVNFFYVLLLDNKDSDWAL